MKIINCTWASTLDLYLCVRLIWKIEIGEGKTFVFEEWRDWEDCRVEDLMECEITEISDAVTDEEIDTYAHLIPDLVQEKDYTVYPESKLESIISFEELTYFQDYLDNKEEEYAFDEYYPEGDYLLDPELDPELND
jgi:hypothetical protein